MDFKDVESNSTSVNWYSRKEDDDGNNDECEDNIRIPVDVLGNKKSCCTHECRHDKRSSIDVNLKKFIGECDELDRIVGLLSKDLEDVGSGMSFYSFRQELRKIRNDALVESYNRKCLGWKFS